MPNNQSDLRSYLAQTDSEGLTLHIEKSVDVHTEVAALCSETSRPIVFRNLRGFEGFQLTDCLTRFRDTQALAMGLERGKPRTVIPYYAGMISKGPSPTQTVEDAPIKEEIWSGADADLSRLPIPVPTEGVDVPHLGLKAADFLTPTISGAMGVTRNPEGKLNTFYTMAKVIGKQRIQFFMFSQHTVANVEAWAKLGKQCPMALVTGCHPLYEMGAAYTGPHDEYSEFNLISTLMGGPIPMIKAETLDLEVPALSEIVIEGFIDGNRAPYLHLSSHSDSYAPFFSPEPFFDVTAITMRKNPIYRHIQPNKYTEHHSLGEIISVVPLFMKMKQAGLPVVDIHMPISSCGNCAIVQMAPRKRDDVRKAMQICMQSGPAPRLTIVVDEDVDIYDLKELMFALSIRVNGRFALMSVEGTIGMFEPLTTLINSPDDIKLLPNNRYAIDATKPPLSEPERRLENVRLTPRGAPRVKLADFIG